MDIETLEKFGLKDHRSPINAVLYHIETMDGVPMCDVPFGSLELVLKCLFECNECVVIHTKLCE